MSGREEVIKEEIFVSIRKVRRRRKRGVNEGLVSSSG